MDYIAHERASEARDVAAAGAIGMLGALLDMGTLPEHHRTQAREILDAYEKACRDASAALDAEPQVAA